MNITLIKGSYAASEALELVGKMIADKIRFQESKISKSCNEEDIKMREGRIKALQNEFAIIRSTIGTNAGMVAVNSTIEINQQA